MLTGFRQQTLIVDGLSLACSTGGDGPPVLMLHGFPQNRWMWAYIAPTIARAGYSVVCADLRGYGDSGKPACADDQSNYSFRQMAQDQVGLMRQLGYERFHVIGHDRGGRAAHRMALDWPDSVLSIAILDIVPTYAMFMETNRKIAGSYWHWYFLSQPAPFPEHMIGLDPDFFYQTCLTGWGATRIANFDQDQLEAYRRAWRDPAMHHGSCSDYRAAATIDLEHDSADIARSVEAPSLVLYGAQGEMARLFDIPLSWSGRFARMTAKGLPGGHFFPDQYPTETASALLEFLSSAAAQRGDR